METREAASFKPQSRLEAAKKRKLFELLLERMGITLPPLEVIEPAPERDPFLFSFEQERLWMLDRLAPGSPFYNVSVLLRLIGRLNFSALSQALNEIVHQHEILRTCFTLGNGEPVQELMGESRVDLCRADLSSFPAMEAEAPAMRLADREAQRPFNLERLPLLRVCLLGLGDELHLMMLTSHHIVCDCWSIEILISELAAIYERCCEGCPISLPKAKIQYSDYAFWQRQTIKGRKMGLLEYWKRELGGKTVRLNQAADHPKRPRRADRIESVSDSLPASLAERLKALSCEYGVTLHVLMLSVLNVLLSRSTGNRDIIVGTELSGRNRLEVEDVIGPFASAAVLRIGLRGAQTFRAVVRRVSEAASEAHEHERVTARLPLNRDQLCEVMFVMQNGPISAPEFTRLKVKREALRAWMCRFDLMVRAAEVEQGIHVSIDYCAGRVNERSMRRMLSQYVRLAETAVAGDDVWNLGLLQEDSR